LTTDIALPVRALASPFVKGRIELNDLLPSLRSVSFPKIVCSPSYVDIRSRANTTRGLNFDHKIKASAHKGDVRIGKTPKKLASICCPQHREAKADTLKATEANRKRGPGTREKVRSKRINLEGNTHAQEINVSQLPV
jgi:hypothetical protein